MVAFDLPGGRGQTIGNRLNAGSFGIMQGRLSGITAHGYQAFPGDLWSTEFERAKEFGFSHIEWIVDSWSIDSNPLLTSPHSILETVGRTGVGVISVCADFLMDETLSDASEASWDILTQTFVGMQKIGAKDVVIPYVDSSSLRAQVALDCFQRIAARLRTLALEFGVRISLETDLNPQAFKNLLLSLPTDAFAVNYDIGNSASLGYDPTTELETYSDRISIVHVKDRVLNGFSVPLGEGNADLMLVLNELKARNFRGIYTMQAFRDQEGIGILESQLAWLDKHLEAVG